MNRPLTVNTAESIADALRFAQAAGEYAQAKIAANTKRAFYVAERDAFILREDFQPNQWHIVIEEPDFIAGAGVLYTEYKAAKRLMYNAERRMMTRYRRMNQGVA